EAVVAGGGLRDAHGARIRALEHLLRGDRGIELHVATVPANVMPPAAAVTRRSCIRIASSSIGDCAGRSITGISSTPVSKLSHCRIGASVSRRQYSRKQMRSSDVIELPTPE